MSKNIELLDAVADALFTMTRYPPMRISRHGMRQISEEMRSQSYEMRVKNVWEVLAQLEKSFENRSLVEQSVFKEITSKIKKELK